MPFSHEVAEPARKGAGMLPDKLKETYEAFFKATDGNDILAPRETVMVQLAASFAFGCYP